MAAAALAALVLVAGAVPATAGVEVARFEMGGASFDPGPALMGDDVVWAEPVSGGAVVRTARAGRGEARTLARLAGPPRSRIDWVDLSASAEAWAAGFTAAFDDEAGYRWTLSEVVAAERGTPARRLVSCGRGPGPVAVSLWGRTLASRIDPCDGLPTGIDVRDPFDSAAPSARLASAGAFEIAGEWIANADGDAFVVREWRTGREVLRRAAEREQGPFALAGDSTLAYSYGVGRRSRLEVSGPAGTRRLAETRGGFTDVRIAHGRVATLKFDFRSFTTSLLVFDLATGRRRMVATDLLASRLDFDGRRLTWLEPTCRGARVAFLSSFEDSFTPKRPRCRRLPVVGRAQLRRGRIVRLRFACSGFATRGSFLVPGCPSRVTVRAPGGRVLGSSRSTEVPGNMYAGAARVPLSRRGRELLRGRSRPRVVVETRLRDDLGRLERRRATVTLRRGE